ncbi:MAG: hypothetical protein ABIH83_05655 [Candidatus Micrarchaeota archaeon]
MKVAFFSFFLSLIFLISFVSADCSGGYLDGEVKCVGNAVFICNVDIWVLQEDCRNNDEICLDGECVEKQCENDDKKCYDATHYQYCVYNSYRWSDPVYCGNNMICENGECVFSSVCQDGDKKCANTTHYQLCSNNEWGEPIYCGSGMECINNNCRIIGQCTGEERTCEDSANYKICINNEWSGPVYCGDGYVCINGYCEIVSGDECINGQTACYNSTHYKVCLNNEWTSPYPCNTGEICTNNYCHTPSPSKCIEGQKRCDPSNSYNLQLCFSDGEWLFHDYCIYGCTVNRCKSSPSDREDEDDDSTEWGCSEGGRRCSGDVVQECYKGTWTFLYSCPVGTYCSSSSCIASGYSSTTYQSGATASSEEEPAPQCPRWGDWTVDSSKVMPETDAHGKTRQCSNTTSIRWCMISAGELDFTQSQKHYSSECSDWSENCQYVYDKKESYTSKSGKMCRTCEDEIYVYTCQPSGEKYYDDLKRQTTCENWRPCSQAELSSLSAEPFSQPYEVDEIVEEYGLVLGIVGIVLLGAILYFLWKMFSAEDEG